MSGLTDSECIWHKRQTSIALSNFVYKMFRKLAPFRIFQVQPDISLPVSRDFVENSPQRPFYNSPIWRDVQCNSEVKLKADKCYLLLAYPWGSTDDKLYVLTFGYDSKVKIHCRYAIR